MKKISVLIVFIVSLLTVSAQTDTTKKATTPATESKLPPAPKTARKPYEMKVPKDRLVLDLNAANWIRHDNANGFRTRVYSRGLNLYAMYDM